MTKTLDIKLQGEICLWIEAQQLRISGQDQAVQLHVNDFSTLQYIRSLLRTEDSPLPSWLTQLLQNTDFLDLSIFIAGNLVARSGPQAKPNYLGRSLGWEGLEIDPKAALAVFSC